MLITRPALIVEHGPTASVLIREKRADCDVLTNACVLAQTAIATSLHCVASGRTTRTATTTADTPMVRAADVRQVTDSDV